MSVTATSSSPDIWNMLWSPPLSPIERGWQRTGHSTHILKEESICQKGRKDRATPGGLSSLNKEHSDQRVTR